MSGLQVRKSHTSNVRMPSTFLILTIGNENLILRGALQGHHNVHTGFITIGDIFPKFKCYRHTHEHHGNVGMLYFLESHAVYYIY